MTLTEKLQAVLKEDPRLAILLAEILAPPPSLSPAPRLWET
ncbi:MAG: hypothetical protein ACK42E_03345 [Candidatus Bipolaricaulaceae bacterium]